MNNKPKYRIGDIVVYKYRYPMNDDTDLDKEIQSKIVESFGLRTINDPKDKMDWYYYTEEILREESDSLEEVDILYKL